MNRDCPKCGTPLDADGLDGLCPKCVALDFLAPETFDSPGDSRIGAEAGLHGGTPFAGYELVEELGRGGMGIVYRARDLALGREVALKFLLHGTFASEAAIARFRKEAETVASLRHPNIVTLFEVGEDQGRLFHAMEWVRGQTLSDLVREGPLPASRAVGYVRRVAEALQYAHDRGVLHRDLKPANVLIDEHDEPRVTDFGLAKKVEPRTPESAAGSPPTSSDSELTITGQILGTPAYISPEQAGVAGDVDERTDVYSLGALFYHLITGRPPFVGESPTHVLRQVADAEPVAPRLLAPSLPRDVETMCLKCLAKEPARRYPTARALAADLARFENGEPVWAWPVSGPERTWRWCRRNRALACSLGLVGLLLMGGAVAASLAARQLSASRRTARQNLYAADLRLAGQLYENGALEAARRLLANHLPAVDREDFRGFDWYYLQSQLGGAQERQAKLPFAPAPDNMPVSRDGRWALLIRGHRAQLLDLPAQRPLAEWVEQQGPGDYLRHVFWSEPARCVVVTGSDHVRLVDPSTGGVSLVGEGGVETAALSGDGRTLAVGRARDQLRSPPPWIDFYDLVTRQRRSSLKLSATPRALSWTPDDALLLVGLAPRTLQWWRPGASKPERELTFSPQGVAANMPWAWFSPDATLVAVPWWDSSEGIYIHDLRDGAVAGRLPGLSHGAARLAWSADSRWLAGSGSEQSILLWERGRWTQPTLLRGPLAFTGGLAFPGPDELVSISSDATARWWRVPPRTDAPLYPNDMTGSAVWRPAWSPDGSLVTIAERFGINSEDKTMRGVLWDVARGEPRFRWEEVGLSFSPDSSRVLTLERHELFRERDTASGAELRRFTLEHAGGHHLPRVSPDWHWMVAWHTPQAGRLYEFDTGRFVAALEGGSEAEFSPDSRTLAREVDRRLVLRDLTSGQERTTAVPCHLAVAWSPDGSELATRDDSETHLVDVATGRERARLTGQTSRIGVILYLPDGRTLLTTGEDGSLRLWNRATLRETITLEVMDGCAYYCVASPNGHCLLAGGARGYRFFRGAP